VSSPNADFAEMLAVPVFGMGFRQSIRGLDTGGLPVAIDGPNNSRQMNSSTTESSAVHNKYSEI
jgi:hypothetical protein